MPDYCLPSQPFVDSKDKVYDAMREILQCLLNVYQFPHQYDEEQIIGYFRQVENVLLRAKKLLEVNHG